MDKTLKIGLIFQAVQMSILGLIGLVFFLTQFNITGMGVAIFMWVCLNIASLILIIKGALNQTESTNKK